MSVDEEKDVTDKKIRFKTPARVLFTTENKIEDVPRNDKEPSEVDSGKKGKYLVLGVNKRQNVYFREKSFFVVIFTSGVDT